MPVLQVRVSDAEYDRLQVLAQKQGITMSALIKRWISQGDPFTRAVGVSAAAADKTAPTKKPAPDIPAPVVSQPILRTPSDYTSNFGAPRPAPKPSQAKRR